MDPERLLSLHVPLTVHLGRRRMRLGDVLRLAPGSVIELPTHADAPLDLVISRKKIASGVAVRSGSRLAVRVTSSAVSS